MLSMCFAPNDFLIIATEENNYYVKLSENFFLVNEETSEKIDEEMSNEETINFLTSIPESQKKKKLQARNIYIENKSDQNNTYQDNFKANKLVFWNNLLSKSMGNI